MSIKVPAVLRPGASNEYKFTFDPAKFRDLAAQKLKDANFPKIEGSDKPALQSQLEAAYADLKFTDEEARQFAYGQEGEIIPKDALFDHDGIARVVIGAVKNTDHEATVHDLATAAAIGLVTIVEPKPVDPTPLNPGIAKLDEVKEPVVEPHGDEPTGTDPKQRVTGDEETDETGDIEGERVDEGALGDQGGGGEGPKKPGVWARFGSWILGGLGILSAIGAFFAHAEGKARAFFAILGGLLLGGAIVNKWHGFGEAIFGKTVKTPKTEGTEVPAPEGVTP